MSDETTTTDNTFRLITGGKTEETPSVQPTTNILPQNAYSIIDIDGNEHFAEGFLVFTSQHIAIMRDTGGGNGLPVLVMPLDQVRIAELLEDDDLFESDDNGSLIL